MDLYNKCIFLVLVLGLYCYETNAASPISLDLYYESMCPYCREFINDQLYPVYKKLGATVLNITLIPYGNAKEHLSNGLWQFHCQHGNTECMGNLIATCAIDLSSYDVDAYFPFINCMELNTVHGHEMTALHKCIGQLNVTEQDVLTCYHSKRGNDLQHNMAVLSETAGVHYSPWIVVQGQHSKSLQSVAYSHLLSLMCSLYTGPLPSACPTIIG